MQQVFITGVHTGLGRALAQACLDRGDRVFAVSRKRPADLNHVNLVFAKLDLADHERIASTLHSMLLGENHIDVAFLNAGVLGELQTLEQNSLAELRRVMDINVWANKVLLDALFSAGRKVDSVVGISSAAAHLGSAGWGGYAMSKAALNVLLNVSANERPATHFVSVAPGLVSTPMLESILDNKEAGRFEAAQRIRASTEEGTVRSPDDAAKALLRVLPKLLALPSGDYADLRDLLGEDVPISISKKAAAKKTAPAPSGSDMTRLLAQMARPGPGRGKAMAELRSALLEKERAAKEGGK